MVDTNQNPMLLTGGELKKAAAKRGISPMLTPEEMLDELIKKLENEKGSSVSSSSTVGGAAATNSSVNNAIMIAKKIIELAENYDDEGIINILNQPTDTRISRNSPIAAMRKCYLKLSLLIHPDKLGRDFEHATKAFQALVVAFERLSSPDAVPTASASTTSANGKNKPLSINRSNEGCYRTIIKCPKCRVAWGDNIDGNPEYYYNFLMMGLKRFSCSTCLFSFGAMTALHYCPFCRHSVEYSPDDYHRKVICGNVKCKKPFGFYCYSTSDRVLNNLKHEVKEELERHIKAKESKLARQARVSSRYGTSTIDEELVFIKGLRDTCPRCGTHSLTQPLTQLCAH